MDFGGVVEVWGLLVLSLVIMGVGWGRKFHVEFMRECFAKVECERGCRDVRWGWMSDKEVFDPLVAFGLGGFGVKAVEAEDAREGLGVWCRRWRRGGCS